jgi:hypothetical protein
MNFALPDDGFIDRTAEIEEVDMRRAVAGALSFLMVISSAWADSYALAPPTGNWNKVQSLPLNTNITLVLKYGEEISGEFISLTEDSITVKELSREKTYPKTAVARIMWMRPGSRARNAAIAGGVLFGIGFGLGYAGAAQIADQNSMPAGERASVGAAFGGLMGGASVPVTCPIRKNTN